MPEIVKARGPQNLDVSLQLGQSELQNRATSFVGWVALFVAAVTLVFSIIAFRSSERWERNQLDALSRVEATLTAMRLTIDRLEAETAAAARTIPTKPPRRAR